MKMSNTLVTAIRSGSREVVIRFHCTRCRIVETLSYEDAMGIEQCVHLHQSAIPNGWKKAGYDSLFCPKCAAAFELFMNGKNPGE